MTQKEYSAEPVQDLIDFLDRDAALYQSFADMAPTSRGSDTDALLAARYRYASTTIQKYHKLIADLETFARELEEPNFTVQMAVVAHHLRQLIDENSAD